MHPLSLRVVIADADFGTSRSLQQMLLDLGCEIIAAVEDGTSLVNECLKVNPDVVITGTLTPEMYGADAAAIISKRQQTPIILFADKCDRDLVLDAEHKHVFMYLVKPIRLEHLRLALENCHLQKLRGPITDDADDDAVVVTQKREYSEGAPYRVAGRRYESSLMLR